MIVSEPAPELQTSGDPVLDLLIERIRSGSTPGRREDDATLALVIEGGGMRGVVSGGMATALHALGGREAFDQVIGTSAGAIAGTCFLSDQPALGTSVYYEELVSGEFINWARAARGGPLVSLEFLLDDVMATRKVLDIDRVLASATPLRAIATRVEDFTPVALGPFGSVAALREALRASARIPLACGPPVQIDGVGYLDGSLTESIPFASAIGAGATHVLALLTRPQGELRGEPGPVEERVLYPLMNRQLRGLGDAHRLRAAAYRAEMLELERMRAGHGAPYAAAIQLPAGAIRVRSLEQDPEVLFRAAAAGAEAVFQALTGAAPRFYRSLAAF